MNGYTSLRIWLCTTNDAPLNSISFTLPPISTQIVCLFVCLRVLFVYLFVCVFCLADEMILVDDLDSLQTDLQALHTSIQRYIHYSYTIVHVLHNMYGMLWRRIQLLESELVVLNDWQVKRDYNRKWVSPPSPPSPLSPGSHLLSRNCSATFPSHLCQTLTSPPVCKNLSFQHAFFPPS